MIIKCFGNQLQVIFVVFSNQLFLGGGMFRVGYYLLFFAVFAAALKAAVVGLPFCPALRIFSGVLPAAFWAAMRRRLF